MDAPVKLSGGAYLSVSEIGATKDAIFAAIKRTLPAESQIYEAIAYILEECRDELQMKIVKL